MPSPRRRRSETHSAHHGKRARRSSRSMTPISHTAHRVHLTAMPAQLSIAGAERAVVRSQALPAFAKARFVFRSDGYGPDRPGQAEWSIRFRAACHKEPPARMLVRTFSGENTMSRTVNAGARLDRLPLSSFHRRIFFLI